MGLRVVPSPKSWQTFQLSVPCLQGFSKKAADRISSSLLKICTGSNKSIAYGFGRRSAHFRSCYPRGHRLKRSASANFDGFSEEELSRQKLNLPDNGDEVDKETASAVSKVSGKTRDVKGKQNVKLWHVATLEPSFLGIQPEPPQWPERDETVRVCIEQRANRVEIPLSLRIIKRKQQWEESLKEAGDFSGCSMKRAFSSMVFMVRELQSSAMHIRERLYDENLHGVIDKVQRELNASFVWLFQQVFPPTPSLMVYVMILLADFTVSSVADNMAAATAATITETENRNRPQFNLDPTTIGSFPVSSSDTGNPDGDGGRVGPAVCGDKNARRSSWSIYHPHRVPGKISEAPFGNDELTAEEEVNLWNSVVEEASRMQAEMRDEALDRETMQLLVSPVTVGVESDDYEDYSKTDLLYQMGLSREPNNPLLLSNYAQFLYLVAHDNDRAEECFKRVVLVEPLDAEGLSRYADFLWKVRKDLWGAEERYQQAVAAEPENPYHASKYANFLWSTGGEETCFPLST